MVRSITNTKKLAEAMVVPASSSLGLGLVGNDILVVLLRKNIVNASKQDQKVLERVHAMVVVLIQHQIVLFQDWTVTF